MALSQCQSGLSVVNSMLQGAFDIDINGFAGIVKTNMVLEMLMALFKER